jgi:dihydropteroate synthase
LEGTTASSLPPAAVSEKPAVSAEEELRRVMPVLEGIFRARPDAVVSLDTYKARVARAALNAGVEIINDVSGFQWDSQMASVCAELKCGVVLMHTRGTPAQWRELPPEADPISRVAQELDDGARLALEQKIDGHRIVLDPGLGFGKNLEENYSLLAQLGKLHSLDFPLLIGSSRKSFIGRALKRRTGRDIPPSERLYGSLAAMVASILNGVHIVRVHDMKPALEAAIVADAVLRASENGEKSDH